MALYILRLSIGKQKVFKALRKCCTTIRKILEYLIPKINLGCNRKPLMKNILSILK